jgi:Lar family restriction alleviation protein
MSDELKPCPFCGGEAYLRDDVSHSTAYFIGCATMDCFGEIHWGQTMAETVRGWNTRAPDPRIEGEKR